MLKYIVFLIGLSFCVYACSDENSNAKGHKEKMSATDSLINSGQIAGGTDPAAARLITANDCLTCHQVNGTKTVGPTFVQIAEKYELNEGNISNLARGIRAGSKGIWGDVQMIPHENVTPEDAAAMARYILSLRTKK